MAGDRTVKQNCHKIQKNRGPGWEGSWLSRRGLPAERNNNGLRVRFASQTHRVSTRHSLMKHLLVCHMPNSSLFQSRFTIVSIIAHCNRLRREWCMAYSFLKWPGERRALTYYSEGIRSATNSRWGGWQYSFLLQWLSPTQVEAVSNLIFSYFFCEDDC